ncbi:WD40 repeat-like protein [Armillaria solidipes]|uniref:WD40 repeat-like protein n=1 Tax=Armillaria solidipes TaxID=1076256 RepID=A0A2H3BC70_9AGAR|nr:WD40 repeat-like protein [Armillaria solidipes]
MVASNDSSSRLAVPLTFSNGNDVENHSVASLGEGSSKATVITSWGLSDSCSGGERFAVIGCQDGTSFVFRPSLVPSISAVSKPHDSAQSSRPSSPLRASRDSRATSRSTSPTSNTSTFPPFTVTPRSRIVSGITTEQVEAPKNYVDFEDEPDKLKDMLKARRSKDRRNSSELRDSTSNLRHAPTLSAEAAFSPAKQRKEKPRSLLSATTSPGFTPKSISTPTSPRDHPLIEHGSKLDFSHCIIPPHFGQGHAVASLCPLNEARYLVLRENGDVSVMSCRDGKCLVSVHADDVLLEPPEGIKDRAAVNEVWRWRGLETISIGEQSLLVLASAFLDANSSSLPSADIEGDGYSQESRIMVFQYHSGDTIGAIEASLEKVGEWHIDGTHGTVGIHADSDNSTIIHYVSRNNHLLLCDLRLTAHPLVQPFKLPAHEVTSLPNPFKAMTTRPADTHSVPPVHKRNSGRILLGQMVDAGQLEVPDSLSGMRTRSCDGALRGLCWSETHIAAFDYCGGILQNLFVQPMENVNDIKWVDDSTYAIVTEKRVEYHTFRFVDANNDDVGKARCGSTIYIQPGFLYAIDTAPHETLHVISSRELLKLTAARTDGKCQLIHVTYDDASSPKQRARTLWRPPKTPPDSTAPHTAITSILPLELDIAITGHNDGRLRQSSFSQLCQAAPTSSVKQRKSDVPLSGYIMALHVVRNGRTKERYVVGGGDDGSIAFWTSDTLKLCARWIVFTEPLVRVHQFHKMTTGPLRGCVLCVSQDGTIAVVVVDGFQFLYLIPGSAFPLIRICLGDDELLLIYADRRARIWDAKTKEFRRSLSLDKAEELIGKEGWHELTSDSQDCIPDTVLKRLPGQALPAVTTLSLDLERFITYSTTVIKTISTNLSQTQAIFSTRHRLLSLLSVLLTPGLNKDTDEICRDHLGIGTSLAHPGFSSHGFTSIYRSSHPSDPWCISSEISAARALSITVTLRALGLFEELTDFTNAVIAFYATSLPLIIGPNYKPHSLSYLARQWFDTSHEVRQSSRLLFDAAVVRLSDEEANAVAEQWQHHLPCLQPTADRESTQAALSLFICGYLAAEKYSLFASSVLTDISKSTALYLQDEQSIFRVLAIDLCSRGFHVWQHYIDAMEILRALFVLATTSRKDAISAQNIGAQARLAVLHIAASNTPLFMTTLGLDILSPANVEYRKSIMQIVAFLIRKRPMVLYPNLPKLMEAVVKSLDPNSTSHRDAILDTATEIIGHVVKTYPCIDFHMSTQRLAVGTSEGAIVMYDLKTAIRLYVLEGHKKGITACSFSPDGRRLVTLSLEESVVLVWKVGSSFSSFFNPGAPPRQGHAGSEPFKTLSFNVGEEANMTASESLTLVRFEWSAERSTKLKIRDSILTFST